MGWDPLPHYGMAERRAYCGFTHITAEPSFLLKENRGVCFSSNDHYDLLSAENLPSTASKAIDIIRDRWNGAIEFADKVREHILTQIV